MTAQTLKDAAVIALVLAAAACDDSEQASLAIRFVVPPNARCQFDSDPDDFVSSGNYDPRDANSFTFTPNVENRLSSSLDSSQEFFDDPDVLAEANTIQMLGFDVCYVRGDDPRVTSFGSVEDGFPVDCEEDSLPGEFVGFTATVEPAGNVTTVTNVLSDSTLATLFDGFAPDLIPIVGDATGGGACTAGETCSRRLVSASANPRDEAWGSFPESGTARVLILARGVGRLNDGDVIRSEYIAYPVDVTPNFVAETCGVLDFPTECIDGSSGFVGNGVDRGESCVPASGFEIACIRETTCPPAL